MITISCIFGQCRPLLRLLISTPDLISKWNNKSKLIAISFAIIKCCLLQVIICFMFFSQNTNEYFFCKSLYARVYYIKLHCMVLDNFKLPYFVSGNTKSKWHKNQNSKLTTQIKCSILNYISRKSIIQRV